MIHQVFRAKIEKGVLKLPLQHKGALPIVVGQEAFVACPFSLPSDTLPELVFTPVPNEYWSDMWEISIETDDRIGVLADFMDLLTERKISVIESTSAIVSNALSHPMRFLVSCARYQSNIDKDAATRLQSRASELTGLEADVLLKLLDVITLGADDNLEFGIKRLGAYLKLHRDSTILHRIQVGQCKVRSLSSMVLPTHIWHRLRKKYGNSIDCFIQHDHPQYLTRIILLPKGSNLILIDAKFSGSVTKSIQEITKSCQKRNLNIVQHSTTVALNNTPLAQEGRAHYRTSRFQAVVQVPATQRAKDVSEKLRTLLSSNAKLSKSLVEVNVDTINGDGN